MTAKMNSAQYYEDWLLVGLKLGHPIPVISEYDLNKEPTCEAMKK